MSKKFIKVDKSDFARVVITETLPSEVPIIFSNRPFYEHIGEERLDVLDDALARIRKDFFSREVKETIPLYYKVSKQIGSHRRLGLIHPKGQHHVVEFYRAYGSLIGSYCKGSPVSLRAPVKVSSGFYFSESDPSISKYRIRRRQATTSDDSIKRYQTSFFAYSGHKRLYKFFESRGFIKAEEKFPILVCLDIQKCFDSIYTHTISWAVKSKKVAKKYRTIASSVGPAFDQVMSSLNHGETSGIVVGPEVSRVFAEMILQDVDYQVISTLEKKGKRFGYDYELRRYVDDIFVFAADQKTASAVMNELSNHLVLHRFHINESKTKMYERPFYTAKSSVMSKIKIRVEEYLFALFEMADGSIRPSSRIRNDASLRFINGIKEICAAEKHGFDSVASYVTARVFSKLAEIVAASPDCKAQLKIEENRFSHAVISMVEVAFYFYSVDPSVGGSFDIAAVVSLSISLAEELMPHNEGTVKRYIFTKTMSVLKQQYYSRDSLHDGFVPLEHLNLVLAVRELGDDFFLPPDLLREVFLEDQIRQDRYESVSYFVLVTLFFYIRNRPEYIEIKGLLEHIVKMRLVNLEEVFVSSEVCYLFLDMMSCPYFSQASKDEILKLFHQFSRRPGEANFKNSLANGYYNRLFEKEWFVKWDGIDLLEELEKIKMSSVY